MIQEVVVAVMRNRLAHHGAAGEPDPRDIARVMSRIAVRDGSSAPAILDTIRAAIIPWDRGIRNKAWKEARKA